jgi:carbonic anhydrase
MPARLIPSWFPVVDDLKASDPRATPPAPFRDGLARDLSAGVVVSLVGGPLCVGIALASGAPVFSGMLAGIVGGVLVGWLSGSETSVSGPAAGLTAVTAAQIAMLGSFEAFLLVVVLAGLLQIGLGLARAGFLAKFVPSSVLKGLLSAIGVLLILKQIPHLLGHDTDVEGEMAFNQIDRENTFTEIAAAIQDIHPGALLIGVTALLMLIAAARFTRSRAMGVPAPLIVVVVSVAMTALLDRLGGNWMLDTNHLIQVPVARSAAEFVSFLEVPDFSQLSNPTIYTAALVLAAMASLKSLMNLDAVDRLDPKQRTSPPSRELVAQGIGNVVSGMIGGLPIATVIIRSTVNINSGSTSRRSAMFYGVILLVSITVLPMMLNLIPLSALAAILIVTGAGLISPKLIRETWAEGRTQFVPFLVTIVAIVLSDPLIGVSIGLLVSVGFILHSNLRRPIRRFVETHLGGDVLHIELANQVSFLNRAALLSALDDVPRGAQVLLDAENTDYIDPDVLDVIREFAAQKGPARGVKVSLVGFRDEYRLDDTITYVDYSTRELQSAMTPDQVLQVLKDGHERFKSGQRLTRDMGRQVNATAAGQHPLAVVLSCIDSRTPAEIIFDLGIGDIFSVRIAGNVTSPNVLGSIEYATAVAGAKLILVMGHTRCGAVTSAVKLIGSEKTIAEATGCQNLDQIVSQIQLSVPDAHAHPGGKGVDPDQVAGKNVSQSIRTMLAQSSTLRTLVADGRIKIIGAMYDVASGKLEFITPDMPDTEVRPPALALLG